MLILTPDRILVVLKTTFDRKVNSHRLQDFDSSKSDGEKERQLPLLTGFWDFGSSKNYGHKECQLPQWQNFGSSKI